MAHARTALGIEAANRIARGARLGRYELLFPIAAGGMGQVWAARLVGSHGFSKLVAIKTILPVLVADPDVEKMFLDEARVAALVHHPNVCQTLELGDEAKTLYMVMEWVDGASFRELLRRPGGGIERVDFPIAARVVADVCAGLHAAHDLVDADGKHLEVVHRDVSPQNVLLTADGAVKVTDFGLVRALGRLHVTQPSRPKGKVGFMAPEQLTGGDIDRRADIFCAGCILYEATTGSHPFPGDGEPQIIARMLIGEYELPSKLVADFPAELEAIIVRALEQEPAKRFESADAMRSALEAFLQKHPVTAKTLGAFVAERGKDIIAVRRNAIRAAAQQVDESDDDATGPEAARASDAEKGEVSEDVPTKGATSTPPPEVAVPPAQRVMRAAVAFGLVVLLGVVAYRLGSAKPDGADDPRDPGPASSASAGGKGAASVLAPSATTMGPQTSAEPRPPAISSGSSAPPPSFPVPSASSSASPKGSASTAPSASSAPTGTTTGAIPTLPNPYPVE